MLIVGEGGGSIDKFIDKLCADLSYKRTIMIGHTLEGEKFILYGDLK